MKKFFTLVALACMALTANAQSVVAEIDWTTQDAYYEGVWYSEQATVSVEEYTGLIIESNPAADANYWEPQVPMIAHMPSITEGGQYKVIFDVFAPAAGDIRLDFCSWDGTGATKDWIGPVEAGDNHFEIEFLDYPTECTDAMIFYQCGKIPGRHVITKVQVLDLEGPGDGAVPQVGGESLTTLWEGEVLVNGWADQPYMLSDGGKELTEAGAAAGDKIRVYGSAPDNSWVVEIFNGHWDGMIERFSAVALTEEDGSPRESTVVDLASQGYFEFTITDEFLTLATTAQGWGGAFLLNGDGNLTVTKVALVKGGASGIKNVKASKSSAAIYNLAGQRVDASYKGVVIQNGKKYVQR